jgi:hypothetical protein
MVHHVVLCKFKTGLTAAAESRVVEELMRQTRSRLLRIPECLTVQCGKRIESDNDWGFFFSVDYETLAKMRLAQKSPAYGKFLQEVIDAYAIEQLSMTYELEPGKKVKYS